MEGLTYVYNHESERQEIMNFDFLADVKRNYESESYQMDIARMMAKSENQSLDEYFKTEADSRRQKSLDGLENQYNFKEIDEVQELKDKYKAVGDKLEQNQALNEKGMSEGAKKLFEVPKGLKRQGKYQDA